MMNDENLAYYGFGPKSNFGITARSYNLMIFLNQNNLTYPFPLFVQNFRRFGAGVSILLALRHFKKRKVNFGRERQGD